MSSYLNIFSGNLISPSQVAYNTFTLVPGNFILSWATSYGSNPNPNIIAYFNTFTPTGASLSSSVFLPDASLTGVGTMFFVNNPTGISFNLCNNGGVVISTISGPSLNLFVLTDNSTANGAWLQAPLKGSTAVTSVGLISSGTLGNIVISGSPITTAGNIQIALGADLGAIAGLGNNLGIPVRQTAGTWSTITLTGTPNQILIANGNGIAGNPTISLPAAISGLDSISLNAGGNLNLGVVPNTISANNTNGNIHITPNGTGNVYLDGISTYTNLLGASLLTLLTNGAGSTGVGLSVPSSVPTTYFIDLPGSIGTTTQVLSISSITTVGGIQVATLAWSTTGTGTVTSINAGTNLTGGTITTTGTIGLSATPTGLTSIGVQNIVSNPSQQLIVPGLTLGTAFQNSTGHDLTMCVILEITVNPGGTIELGVGSSVTPVQQTIYTGTATLGFMPITFKLPSGYYALLSVTTLTAVIRGQYAVPN